MIKQISYMPIMNKIELMIKTKPMIRVDMMDRGSLCKHILTTRLCIKLLADKLRPTPKSKIKIMMICV